jgi:hypothetical protein
MEEAMKPQNVLSPRANWQLTDVLYENADWALALGKWRDEEGNWRPVLAQRWNGHGDEKGMPTSRGISIWFVIPDETYFLYADSRFITSEKRPFVKAVLGLDVKTPGKAA